MELTSKSEKLTPLTFAVSSSIQRVKCKFESEMFFRLTFHGDVGEVVSEEEKYSVKKNRLSCCSPLYRFKLKVALTNFKVLIFKIRFFVDREVIPTLSSSAYNKVSCFRSSINTPFKTTLLTKRKLNPLI